MKSFIRIFVGLALLCGLGASTLFALGGTEIRSLMTPAIFRPYPDGRDSSWHTAGGEERVRASNEHFNIALQISRCFPGINLAWGNEGPPAKVSVAFMLNMQPNGEEIWTNADTQASDVELTNWHRAVLTISRSAIATRTELAASAAQSRSTMLLYQWLIVIVGALTTVLVSIKSMSNGEESNNRGYFLVGILAVVFSAIGTALASINSFVGPNDAYVRSERALLQVRQLHLELALQVAQEKDVCHSFDPDKTDDPRGKQLTDLSTRLKEVVASSGFSSNSSSAAGAPSATSSSATVH